MAAHADRQMRRLVVVLVSIVAVTAAAMATAPAARGRPTGPASAAPPPPGPFATLLFSRTQITAADNCVVNNTNIARLDTTVAPYLRSLGMTATGSLITDKTGANAVTCSHKASSMSVSWAQATSLAHTFGWSFVSHTATYPADLSVLTPAQAEAETCGSARTIDSHGLPGGHGLIAYPGAQSSPVALQTNYGSRCFAWGRRYYLGGVTVAAAATTAPYWQNTTVPDGGACNVSTAACYTIHSDGSPRYNLPGQYITSIRALQPGQWFTLQSYILVTGKNPAYTSSPLRWDCTSPNRKLHWTNDNERYCYQDWQAIVQAIDTTPGVIVTDPLTVGVAFGRPGTYP